MTKITYIPGEIANAAIDEHGNRKPVTRTQHIFDDAKNKSQAEINKEYGNAIGGLNSQNYVTVDSFNALPAIGKADTVYRVSNWDGSQQDPTVYSEYAWDGSQYIHLSTKTKIGEVFDISAYHATGGTLATYADLSAALDSNNGGGVPQSLQKGGMSIKFIQGTVQSSDHKYVQYRLMADTFTTTESDWQGVDDTPTTGSDNLVKSGGVFANEFLLSSQMGEGFRAKKKYILPTLIRTLNKAIGADGSVLNYDDYAIYGPISLEKDDCIEFTCNIGREVAVLSLIVGGVYKPIIIDNNANAKVYSYRATEDCQIEICTLAGGVSTGFDIDHPVGIPFLLGSEGVDIDFTTKGYVDDNGTLVTSNTYYITDPIQLKKGDVLKINAKGTSYNYLCGYNNGTYTPKLRGTINLTDDNFYICENDEQVVIGGLKADGGKYQIFGSNAYVLENELDAAMSTVYEKIAEADIIDIETVNNVVIETQNAYIDKDSGNPVNYNNYNISAPISIKEGETISATFGGTGVAAIAKYNEGAAYTVLVVTSGTKEYEYTADEDCQIAFSGSASTLNNNTEYTIVSRHSVKNTVKEIIKGGVGSFSLINPYAGANFDNQVLSNSHEHCYDKGKLESAYNRGIRCISCSHYIPSTPRYPFSSFNTPYQDYKSKQAYLDNDRELVTRYTTGSIPTLNVDGDTIYTDDIPQIANAERGFVKDIPYTHMNILGLLWGSAGNALCNGELTNSAEDLAIKLEGSLESTTKFNQLLEDPSMWQFGPQYAFGTVNHCNNLSKATYAFEHCPQIFKAMELFNQGYSEGWNQSFKDTYDALLKSGKRVWGTAVVDWQGDWATWNFTTAEEKAEWQEKYEQLTPSEQEEYGSAENYYMETGRYKFDRGCNVMLMDNAYNSKTADNKAKDIINAYIAGRYYMSGLNTRSMKLYTDNHLVTFMLSDIATKVKVITANGFTEYTNVNNVQYVAQADDKYIRFEAYFGDGDFIYSNPVWVEL